MSLVNDFADLLHEQKKTLQLYVNEAAQYGFRSEIEGAIFRLNLEWTECRRGTTNLESIFQVQDEADQVIDNVLRERFKQQRRAEIVDALIDEYGADNVATRAEHGWFEDWEVRAALDGVRERASISFRVDGS